VFLHPLGSTGHVVRSDVSDAQNADTPFFMLVWDRYRFHKKCDDTSYTEYVFLHPVESTGHVVHSGASRHEIPHTIFHAQV
jgi:hypothetical protein